MKDGSEGVFTGAYGVGLTAEEISRTVAQAKAEQKPVTLYRRDLSILTALADGTTLPPLPAELQASLAPRAFAPRGDRCNCEAEDHGHGCPCDGHAAAGKNKLLYVGEVCDACYAATPAVYRQAVAAVIDDLAKDAQEHNPRLTAVRAVLAQLLTGPRRNMGMDGELEAVRYLASKNLACYKPGSGYHISAQGREVALALRDAPQSLGDSTARRGR